jgi:hypothetical protein
MFGSYCSRAVAAAALVVSCITLSAPVQAEESTRRVRIACTGDARRLCPQHKLGSSEMRYCMEAKGRQLSRTCVTALEDEGIAPRGYFRR